MSEELLDEVTSINSIYGDSTLLATSGPSAFYTLILPSQPNISLRLDFPPSYPDAPPSILGTEHIGSSIAKGEGQQLVEIVRSVLAEVYIPGSPCIFDLVEESGQRLQQLGLDQISKEAESQATQADGQEFPSDGYAGLGSDKSQELGDAGLGDPPPWILSDVVTEKKSVFVARAAAVTSVDQAKVYLAHLLATDKKAAKATHNITAWRIRDAEASGVQFQDCDDDGETAAGGRLLHLLELMGVWNVMVVVTRWYGGVQLGPDRFRIINQTAREAIVKGGFVTEDVKDGKDGGKKKGKR